jgi:prepilin-type N-terminal cleavage/methylation domain-containing protein
MFSRKQRVGFTLIELLVVTANLAVLIASLLPAVRAEIPRKVYYISPAGFDTNAAPFLLFPALQEPSRGLATFHRDLKARRHLD